MKKQNSNNNWIKENCIRIIFCSAILIVGILSFFFSNHHFKEASSLFYVFSTIAQTVGTILGIISAVLIFTVASLDTKRDSLKPTIVDILKKVNPDIIINHFKLEEFVKSQKVLSLLKEDPNYMDFVVLISTYKSLRLYKDYILKSCRFTIIITAVTILYCIFGLMVTELVIISNIALVLSIVAVLLCIWTILEITYYIIRLPDIATSLELELENILDGE